MRNLKLISILSICLVGAAQADLFTFDALSNGNRDTQVSTYMTGVSGSAVTASGVRAGDNTYWAASGDWLGKANGDVFVKTYGSSDLEIVFATKPFLQTGGQGYVFSATSGADFTVKAYDSTYNSGTYTWFLWKLPYTGEDPNPSALVYSNSWNASAGTQIDFSAVFTRPVSLLVFSDSGSYDVGIDNLYVGTPSVPVPGAVLLGVLGLGAAGRKLRKMC
jgi:hypothetical protein